ncbi:putative sterigmatocystin biosynthesis P450 monooxygenase [Lachnellula subtilissima]|uniref:Putative sterigmatocystin biosynthesis P450 monooxygenase n=1 Tax=Lachnellula subtilissima TaxID=602034 RepID=A0A8H8UEN6_9HELO|nr:putative sterigmatocystin biosynthesis P450 monooxygenase [Lachnellula subtilissima]
MLLAAPTLLVFGASALLLLFIIKLSLRAFTGPLRGIPGPRLNRCTNLPLKYYVLRGQRCHYIHHLHTQYGPTVRIGPEEIAIADLPSSREIHRIGSGYVKSAWYARFTGEKTPGIFAMRNLTDHAMRRRLFSYAFSQNGLLHWEDLLQARSNLAVSRIKQEAESGSADVLKWWTLMASDIIAEMGFGESFGALEYGQPTQLSRDLAVITIFGGIQSELAPLSKIAFSIPLPSIQEFRNCRVRISSHGRSAIARNRALSEKGETGRTIFNKIVAEAENKSALTDEVLAGEARALIVAGSDTTARTLTYLIWAALKHPSVKQRLQDEIDRLPSGFSSKDATELPYLMVTIKETLRLYGAAPGSLPRSVPFGGRTLGGYLLPQGTTVSTQAWTLHRDAAIFERPLDFIPERWFEPTQNMKDAFMPFGGGSRICIGMHLAYMEMALSVAKFFRACPTATMKTNDEDMEVENHFLIAPKGHKCEIGL